MATTQRPRRPPTTTDIPWMTYNTITISPSETSIPPTSTESLSSGTVYYTWSALAPPPSYTTTAYSVTTTPASPPILPKGIIILQHGWSEYARRWMETTPPPSPHRKPSHVSEKSTSSNTSSKHSSFSSSSTSSTPDDDDDDDDGSSHLCLGEQLRSQGWEIWAMDLYAHGASQSLGHHSGGKTKGNLDVRKAVGDLEELIGVARGKQKQGEKGEEEEEEKEKRKKVFVLGHGLGGVIAARAAIGDRVRGEGGPVDGVILTAPDLKRVGKWEGIGLWVGARIGPDMPVPWVKRMEARWVSRLRSQADAYECDPLRLDERLCMMTAWTRGKVAKLVWKGLGDWDAPVLVLHGEKDPVVSALDSEEMVSSLPAKDKKIKVVKGGYHDPLRDIGHDELVRDVIAWVEKRSTDS